jgi:WD40 repeat protein
MTYTFISYSREDLALVDRLRSDLERAEISLWIDRLGLQPGTPDWDEALRDAIEGSQAVLFAASPNSRRSPYVRDELALARASNKPVYPVWIAGDDWLDCVPIGWGSTQAVDLRGAAYDAGFSGLRDALKGKTSRIEAYTPIATTTVLDLASPRNPYKGLRAFREDDSRDYFGREALIDTLISRIGDARTAPRLHGVLGASGSGKSSLMMAGVLPRLRSAVRQGSDAWVYLDPMSPGNNPLERLTITLARRLQTKSHALIRQDLDDRSGKGLYRLAAEISDQPTILYIDQFEELFTLTTDEAERRQFIDLLHYAITVPDGSLYVLLSMRADFYDRPAQYREFGALLEGAHTLITPMSLADLYDVVQLPVEQPDVRLIFEKDLATEIVFSVLEEPAALPLLQFTLDQLFERREGHRLTHAAYKEIGGVKGAIAKHAEDTFAKLDAHGQTFARALFLRLIEVGLTPQDTTRRRARLDELSLESDEDSQRLRAVAQHFVDARLLTTDSTYSEDTIEVSHEALLREWERLGGWVADARDDLRIQRAVSATAADWVRRGRRKDDDQLYRGEVLAEARGWSSRNFPSRDERAFIVTSEESERREADARRRQVQALRLARFALISAIIMALGIGLFLSAQLNQQQRESTNLLETQVAISEAERLSAEIARLEALAESERAERNANASFAAELAAEALNNTADLDLALLLGIEAGYQNFDPSAQYTLLTLLNSSPSIRAYLHGHTASVESISISPDSRTLITAGDDNKIIVWDLTTLSQISILTDHASSVHSVAFSHVPEIFASADDDGHIYLWQMQSGRFQRVRALDFHEDAVLEVAFSPDGQYLAAASRDHAVSLWEVESASSEPIRVFSNFSTSVNTVAFHPDGDRLAAGGDDGMVYVWDVQTGDIGMQIFPRTVDTANDQVTSIAFSPDGSQFAVAIWNGSIEFWSSGTAMMVGVPIQASGSPILSIAFHPDGTQIAAASYDQTVTLWDINTYEQVGEPLSGHSTWIQDVEFSADGETLVSGSRDEGVIVWNTTPYEGPLIERHLQYNASLIDLRLSHDGSLLAVGGSDGKITLWNVADTVFGERFTADMLLSSIHTDPYTSLPVDEIFLSHNADMVGAVSGAGLRIWNIATGQETKQELTQLPELLNGLVFSAAFSPDDTVIVIAYCEDYEWQIGVCTEPYLRFWDTINNRWLDEFEYPIEAGLPIASLAFQPAGTLLAVGYIDGNIELIDWRTGEVRQTFELTTGRTDTEAGQPTPIRSLYFSPNGQLLAARSWYGASARWNVQTEQLVEYRENLTHTIDGLSFLVWSWVHQSNLFGGSFYSLGNGCLVYVFPLTNRVDEVCETTHNDISLDEMLLLPEQNRLLTGGRDNKIMTLDASTGLLLNVYYLSAAGIDSLFASLDRQRVGWIDVPFLQVFDIAEEQGRYFIPSGSHPGISYRGALHPNNFSGVVAHCFEVTNFMTDSECTRTEMMLIDLSTEEKIGSSVEVEGTVFAMEFSPDGRSLYLGITDGVILVLDVSEDGLSLSGTMPEQHGLAVFSFAFDPSDPNVLASASQDGTILLWDTTTRQPMMQLSRHSNSVFDLVFSPDGDLLYSASGDESIIVWEIGEDSGRVLGILRSFTDWALNLELSPNGKTLYSSSRDGHIIIWNVEPASFVDVACQLVRRNLTEAEWAQYMGDQREYRQTCEGF